MGGLTECVEQGRFSSPEQGRAIRDRYLELRGQEKLEDNFLPGQEIRDICTGVVIEGESSIEERLKVHVRFEQADLCGIVSVAATCITLLCDGCTCGSRHA